MKIVIFILGFLEAVLFVTSAYPLGNWPQRPVSSGQLPKPIKRYAHPHTRCDKDNYSRNTSFGSSNSDDSSSSHGSSKSRFLSLFQSKQSSNFECHSYPEENILSDLAVYITELLNTYRDELFSHKGDPDRIPFETCFAGYAPDQVSPTIYFSSMTKSQTESVTKLLSNQVVRKFPRVKVVALGKTIALVHEDNRQIRRRATV